ncbi:MAG TPA: type IV secretion system DNA-binding domain-containing protein [Steroidobacteraceae bacterium]|jgi:type IV secretory pathway TraG/TraD family ATPase VirD4|nr:type IV secretion system DNA-binding domain-containing protein [Steroidobacteraceae bacterium]
MQASSASLAAVVILLVTVTAVIAGSGAVARLGDTDRHRRGARLRTQRAHRRRSVRWPPAITMAGVPLRLPDEMRHFKLIGTTGTGKSTAIRELLHTALLRGDRAIISDPDGTYLRRFMRPYRGDLLLNPFEPESARWDLFAELRRDCDAELLCEALISPGIDASSQEWRSYARTFLAALLRRCRLLPSPSTTLLWRLLSAAPVQELRALLANTPAQPFMDPDNARMFASIRAVASAAVAPLEHIARQRAAPLAVRSWVRTGRGVLFLPYRANQIAALRALIAAWLRLAIFETMDGAEEVDQRLWFVVDELDALGSIAGLKDALARLRKFGGRCVLGWQSVAQVSSTYGSGEAQTIVENCGNTLILRCAGSEHGGTSAFAARLIGEREVIRRQQTDSREIAGPWAAPRGSRSRQSSEQRHIEQLVLASELEQLPDLCGYLKVSSARCWRRVRLRAPHSRP